MADPILVLPSRNNLKRGRGGRDGLYPWLELLSPDVVHIIPPAIGEFVGDTLHGGFQSTASGTAAAAAAISTGLVNGAILLDAGTDDNGRSDLSLGLHCRGDLNAVVYARLQISAITSVKFEMGFTDVISGTDAGAVNVLATPSFTATDFCGWVMDTDDDGFLQAAGVDSGVVATKIEPGLAPTAATYLGLVVALRDTNAKFYVLDANGQKSYESEWMTGAVSADVLLTPWVFMQNRSATQRTMTIDTFLCWQRRTTS